MRFSPGKMFIANVDADRMGIHGHRLVINEDNSIEKVSFKTFIFLELKLCFMIVK